MKTMDTRHDSRVSPARKSRKGFSLMELMITLAVVAVLLALAYPSYARYVRKANRGEAQQLLLNWANNQEIWRSNNPTYADDVASPNGIPVPVHGLYTFSLGAPNPPTASEYLLVATAQGDQAKDGVASEGQCATLNINQTGNKTPTVCWD
jgi:type IV pilus assembly protein PilE